MKTRQIFLAVCLASALHAAGTGNPNIVLILADDLGYGDHLFSDAAALPFTGGTHSDYPAFLTLLPS